MVSATHASGRIKWLARQVGFDLVRIAEARPLEVERDRYLDWVEAGRQADMRWITPEHAVRSADPTRVLPDARSVISLAMSYWSGHRPPVGSNRGRVARYAWGDDYHSILDHKLTELATALKEEFGGDFRWYVDTGPVMDRALAARAGLGWYGKNTNILTETHGSFVFLAEIVTTLLLQPDPALRRDCGSCRLCQVACPTGALAPDYSLDSRKCISYLTIEHRGPISPELRPLMGDWVLGCDICQDVCPPNMAPHLSNADERRRWVGEIRATLGSAPGAAGEARPSLADEGDQRHTSFDLLWLLRLTHEEYLEAFRGTAIRRAKVWMLRRNAAIALGNVGDVGCIRALLEALRGDEHPVVRGHAAWAVDQLARRYKVDITEQLCEALRSESDPEVKGEIRAALEISA